MPFIDHNPNQPRRDFLRAAGRYIALGFLAMIGGAALLRNRDGKCEPYPLCQGCGLYDNCSLPQAIKQKSHQERRNGQA